MTIIGDIFKPLFYLIAGLIAFFYGLVHNYAIAIALLTITVMAFLWPLTALSTRRMIAMQKIQPDLKEIQTKYKSDRVRMSEEMNRLFKENKVSPVSGCLPMLLQFPVLFVMYDVIRGLTNRTAAGIAAPKYVGHTTSLYKDLIKSNGVMHSLGIDLGMAATHVKGFANALPYYVVVLLAIGLVFLSTYQIYSKNPQAASANPQQAAIMKYTPLIYGVIYIGIPAGVNLYFVVSSLFRIGQQEFMWRRDPLLRSHSEESRQKANEIKELKASGKYVAPPKKGFMDRVREASMDQQQRSSSSPQSKGAQGGKPRSNSSNNKKKKK